MWYEINIAFNDNKVDFLARVFSLIRVVRYFPNIALQQMKNYLFKRYISFFLQPFILFRIPFVSHKLTVHHLYVQVKLCFNKSTLIKSCVFFKSRVLDAPF